MLNLAGFGGVNCAIDSRILPDYMASDMQDVRIENGDISPRFGYRNLLAAQSGFSAIYGLNYVQGYDDITEKEEYLTVETVSGNTRAFSRPADDGDPATEIKNGVSSVNLNASEWAIATFDSRAYFMNPLNTKPIYVHDIGDATSMVAMDIPESPTVAPSYVIKYGGGENPYTQIDYAGINPATEIVYTGAAHTTDSVLNSDNTLTIGHGNSDIESSFQVDWGSGSAGVQDFSYNDRFAFNVTCEQRGFRLDESNIRPAFLSSGGTVLTPDYVKVSETQTNNQFAYTIQFGWNDKPDRSRFSTVRYLRLTYLITASDGALDNTLKVSKMWKGGIDMTGSPPDRLPDPDGLQVGYSYYFSTPGFESGLSPALIIPNSVLSGYAPGGGMDPLGVHLEIPVTASADTNVDQFRVYATGTADQSFRRIATQADSDLTYDLRISYLEIKRLPEFVPTPFEKVTEFLGNPINAFAYKGSFVWLYNQGRSNIKYSRIGDAIRQASVQDDVEDQNRGATFTMADAQSDVPLGGVQTGDAAMIAGKQGVYVQFGDFPAQMTPCRRVSGSFGVAGKYAFDRWKDDNGIQGMVYVSPDGQIYFAIPGDISGPEAGDNIILSGAIRTGVKSLKTWLLDGQSALGLTDFSTCQVKINHRDDTLVVLMGQRGLKLRRPDIHGVRHWEPFSLNTGGSTVTVRYIASSPKWGIRWIRSDGKFDEDEFNTSTRAYIVGANRDGGNAMPTPYWTSKVFVDRILRTLFVKVFRDDLTNTPTVTDYSTGVPAGTAKTVASGRLGVMFPVVANGSEHSFKVALGENYGAIKRIQIEQQNGGNRRQR